MRHPLPEVAVRPARQEDLDGLVDLTAAVAAEGRWIGTEAPLDRERRRRALADRLAGERALLLVAEVGGRPIGELWMDLASYGVADLGMLVAEDWRGRGVGSALLGAGIDWARRASAHKVSLQVWPHNQAAIALYEKFGFRREGLLRRHYRRRNGELWDAVVMGLPLEPDPGGGSGGAALEEVADGGDAAADGALGEVAEAEHELRRDGRVG